MLEEVQNYMDNNLDPDVKASRILQNLNGKDRDPEVNKAFEDIDPQTARFLADLIGDVMTRTEKNKMFSNLSKQVQRLID